MNGLRIRKYKSGGISTLLHLLQLLSARLQMPRPSSTICTADSHVLFLPDPGGCLRAIHIHALLTGHGLQNDTWLMIL